MAKTNAIRILELVKPNTNQQTSIKTTRIDPAFANIYRLIKLPAGIGIKPVAGTEAHDHEIRLVGAEFYGTVKIKTKVYRATKPRQFGILCTNS